MNRYNIRACAGDAFWPTWRREFYSLADASPFQNRQPLLLRLHGLPRGLSALVERLLPGAASWHLVPAGDDSADMWLMVPESDAVQMVAALRATANTGASDLAQEIDEAVAHCKGMRSSSCRIGSKVLSWGQRTYVMGILNLTPDSFSGDGLWPGQSASSQVIERAVAHALQMLSEGADIVDIGGESTRPGAAPLDADQELERVLPVIRRLRQETDAPISIDTYKASVAEAALAAGADLVNDVWGLKMDPDMGRVVAAHEAPIIIMHNRSKPRNAAQEQRLGGRYVGVHYDNLISDILRELRAQIEVALSCGISEDRIIVDPGIGFGKTVEQNLALLDQIGELRVLGYPILLGPSRKSFIGFTLDLPPEERMEGTLATLVAGVLRGGAQIVRVHDIRAAARAVRMADAISRTGDER